MKHRDYNKLKSLAKHINHLISTGKWNTLVKKQQSALRSALERLLSRVQHAITKRKLVRVLGMAIALISSNTVAAQTFAAPVLDPFEITRTEDNYYIKPQFIDIDGDGDKDYFYADPYESGIIYQENIGTAEVPNFAEMALNPFELETTGYPVMLVFGDLDNDGDFDMLSSDYDSFIISFYENIGTATDPTFESPVAAPFGILPEISFTNSLVDIDNDGDLDLFSTGFDFEGDGYRLSFHENIGTPELPEFVAGVINPFGVDLTLEDYWFYVDFADIDEDGDLDFIRTDTYGKFVYFHENIGDEDTPEFEAGAGEASPFDIEPLGVDEYFVGPKLVDIDADGDLDLFISEYYGGNFFFENLDVDIIDDASIADSDLLSDQISIFPNPTTDYISLNTELTNEDIQSIQITTVEGRQVYQSDQLINTINVKNYPVGLYIVAIRLNNGQQAHLKFIKE